MNKVNQPERALKSHSTQTTQFNQIPQKPSATFHLSRFPLTHISQASTTAEHIPRPFAETQRHNNDPAGKNRKNDQPWTQSRSVSGMLKYRMEIRRV